MKLYIAVDVSDDDVTVQEIAEQCGYDLKHPAVHDVGAPEPVEYLGESCLLLRVHLLRDITATDLLQEAQVLISHPSVSSVRKLWVEA